MNERIEELAEQAEEWVCKNHPDAMDDNDEFHAQTMEKFAELIVKETMQVVANNLPQNTYLDVADAVIEHFGVEE